MKLNEHTALLHPYILLVPYSRHHVPTYHTWMQSPTLQAATASEPLTLDQEYAMQKSWREDGDKLTFIACLPLPMSSDGDEQQKREDVRVMGGAEPICPDSGMSMVGDVNLFLSEGEGEGDGDGDGDDVEESAGHGCVGEVEIMVARTELQGNGVGMAILLTFLWYVLTHLDAIVAEYSLSLDGKAKIMKYLRVKIDAGNERSTRLFEKVGFKKTTEKPNYFNELELRHEIPKGRGKEDVARALGVEEPKVALYQLV